MNRAAPEVLKRQAYAPGWNGRVGHSVPEWIRGALVPSGRTNLSEPAGQWVLDQHGGNYVGMSQVLLMAHAYLNEWDDLPDDEELLRRTALALDFYVRAQGKNAGFARKDGTWIRIH